jgi:hypothetical protein
VGNLSQGRSMVRNIPLGRNNLSDILAATLPGIRLALMNFGGTKTCRARNKENLTSHQAESIKGKTIYSRSLTRSGQPMVTI